MKIAILSTPHLPTPPPGHGGSEMVAGLLAAGLAREGHEVVVVGHPDSRPGVPLLTVPEASRVERFDWRELAHVGRALPRLHDVDLIHNHCVNAGPPLAALAPRPMLTTLHYIHPLTRCFPDHPYVAVSHSQRRQAEGLRVVSTIWHGIDVEAYRLEERKDDYLLFLGRVSPNKGPDVAIAVARRLGCRLVLAGPVLGTDDYFDQRIRPQLDRSIAYVGEVQGREKVELLARARCLVLPLRWEEPFGLVMVEAMACGTPVVATRRGAAPELVRHGVTGFLVDSTEEFVAAVSRVHALRPADCRRHVAAHFTVERMVAAYLRVYRQVLEQAEDAPWS
ncbi:MAG TPA: glycosyltransferase family 4 protein [Chloroflexota bacterium]